MLVVATPSDRMAVYGRQGPGEVLGHQMGTFRLTPSADAGQLSAAPPEVAETASINILTAELTELARCVAGGARFRRRCRRFCPARRRLRPPCARPQRGCR